MADGVAVAERRQHLVNGRRGASVIAARPSRERTARVGAAIAAEVATRRADGRAAIGRRRPPRQRWRRPAPLGRGTGRLGRDRRARRERRHDLATPAGTSPCAARTSRAAARSIAAAVALRQPLEHVEILALDDRPVVVIAEELPAVPAEAAREPPVVLDGAQRFDELRLVCRSRGRRCCGCTGP